jgi:hypothetical protein
MNTKFNSENLNEDNSEDLNVDGRNIAYTLEGVEWIVIAEDRVQWWTSATTMMNPSVQ